jgi:uncharacterized protein YqhQ
MGGQAVVEGVMMRGERTWAIAVRTPEGDIEIETHETPTWAEKWAKIPLVRGVMALAESMSLGMRALTWSANRQIPEEEQISSKAMGWTIGAALLLFTGVFILLRPLIAGISYEVIRFAAKHMDKRWVRVAMKPGLLLQRLTTREPSLDQVEVAVMSLRAVLTAEQLAEVDARPRRLAAAGTIPRPALG